jgi:signal transduction histidine kinase
LVFALRALVMLSTRKIVWSVLLALSILAIAAQTGALRQLLSSNYLPHRYCYLVQPGLVWTNVSMDGLIAGSYLVIFAALFWMASRLRQLPEIQNYLWIFLAFGTFIVACGLTHVMEVVTVWWPVYRLSAAVKVVCALASVPTAVLFVRVAPALAAYIHSFVVMLSTTQKEKDQAMVSLIASEKLAVAGRISATIAHEIKGPLQTVSDLLYLLRSDPHVSPDLRPLISTAESEIARAGDIARSTLSLYREAPSPVRINLGTLVEGVLGLQKAETERRKVRIDLRIRVTRPMEAYPGEIRQIIINLLQNAIVASPAGGRVFLRVQPRGCGYALTIADEGCGIEAEHRARLFSLFFSTKGDDGTGLGLWLVKSLVEKHGGTVGFRSRVPGEAAKPGTLFSVWLPFTQGQVSAEKSLAAAPAGRL